MNYQSLYRTYAVWMRDHFTYSFETAQRTMLHDPELGRAMMDVVDAVVRVRDIVKTRLARADGKPSD